MRKGNLIRSGKRTTSGAMYDYKSLDSIELNAIKKIHSILESFKRDIIYLVDFVNTKDKDFFGDDNTITEFSFYNPNYFGNTDLECVGIWFKFVFDENRETNEKKLKEYINDFYHGLRVYTDLTPPKPDDYYYCVKIWFTDILKCYSF